MKDIIELQESIRAILEEIESSEAHLRLLSDQVSYSSLNINLYQPLEYIYKPVAEDSFIQRVKHALNNGWVAVVGFSLVLLNIWPLIIIGFVSLVIVKRVRRRKGEGCGVSSLTIRSSIPVDLSQQRNVNKLEHRAEGWFESSASSIESSAG